MVIFIKIITHFNSFGIWLFLHNNIFSKKQTLYFKIGINDLKLDPIFKCSIFDISFNHVHEHELVAQYQQSK